jgi:hypothetical protein
MADLPILFSAPKVRALLDAGKHQPPANSSNRNMLGTPKNRPDPVPRR